MTSASPRVSICIPHWQVERFMKICLRSIRRHSQNNDIEVIVVDNGSRDGSLDYLRSLEWIRLIERPEETSDNWPRNVYTAWDRGIREATGEFFVTMHSDVFVRRDDWLDLFLRAFGNDPQIAGVGAWKLNLESPLYAWQKRVFGVAASCLKSVVRGRLQMPDCKEGHFPRDYCAMYRCRPIIDNDLSFDLPMHKGGGYPIAAQLWDAGYSTRMIPVHQLARSIMHVAHGTAGLSSEKPLRHQRAQRVAERRVAQVLNANWVRQLESDSSLDRLNRAA